MTAATFDRAALNRMYRYCFTLTNDKDAAYDLLQDGLERYLRASGDTPDAPAAFLRRIIRNLEYPAIVAKAAGNGNFPRPVATAPVVDSTLGQFRVSLTETLRPHSLREWVCPALGNSATLPFRNSIGSQPAMAAAAS